MLNVAAKASGASTPSGFGRGLTWAFLCASVAMTLLCALLMVEIRSLRAEIASVRAGRIAQLEPTLGATAENIRAETVTGDDYTVAFGPDAPSSTVLLVYSPLCPLCEKNMDSWRRLTAALSKLPAQRVLLLDISGQLTESGFHALLMPPSVLGLTRIDARLTVTYQLGRVTPQTIVVDRAGSIRGVWSGLLTDSEHEAILNVAAGGIHPS